MKKSPTYRFRFLTLAFVSRIVMFVALCSFLLSNIGLTVYTHFCSISGIQTSIFFDHDEICGDDKHVVFPTSCCVASSDNIIETEGLHFDSSPCCSTETNYLLLDIDTHIEKTEFKLVEFNSPNTVYPLLCIFTSLEFFYSSFSLGVYNDVSVPKYQGRDLQSLHQVYII